MKDNIILWKLYLKNVYDLILHHLVDELKKIPSDSLRMECENDDTISLNGLRSEVIMTSDLLKKFISPFTTEKWSDEVSSTLGENFYYLISFT